MSTLTRLALASLACLAGGCTPLQQAPLVYSSKVTVGLDVSANVAENQGASINIGVRTIDSAYVPVAVSKEIDKRGKDEKTVELKLIEARYGYGEGSDGSDPAHAAERDKKIDAYFLARQNADTAARNLATREDEAKALESQATQLASLRSRIEAAQKAVDASPPEAATRADLLAPLVGEVESVRRQGLADVRVLEPGADNRYNAQAVAADLNAAIATRRRAREALATADLPALRGRAQEAAAAAAKAKDEALKVAGLSNTNKSDAMSVYGSFDSRASGEAGSKTSAGLLIGKVFSTGLASQNLTEAVKIGANVQCFTTAVEALKSATTEERLRILDTVKALCTPKTTMTAR